MHANLKFIVSRFALLIGTVCVPTLATADDSSLHYEAGDKSPSTLARIKINQGLPESFEQDALVAKLKLLDDTKPIFGWFIYGDSNSRSVSVMLLKGESDRVFVDANRDKVFTADEELSQTNSKWRTKLKAEFVIGQSRFAHQTQMVELFINAKNQISLGTMGAMVGTAEMDGELRMAKYVDQNSNGIWSDPKDRIFVDLNNDKKISKLTERFSCKAMCKISDRIYAIASHRKGTSLALDEVLDTGTLVPQITLKDKGGEVVKFEASVSSDNGVRMTIDKLGEPIECPIGTYHVESVSIQVKNENGFYRYAFASDSKSGAATEVEADESGNIELIGNLSLSGIQNTMRGKQVQLTINPILTTDTGLYLIGSSAGTSKQDVEENRLTAQISYMGEEIGFKSSGFS